MNFTLCAINASQEFSQLTDGKDALRESPSGDGIMNAEVAPRHTRQIARIVEAWKEAIELRGCREGIT